MNAITDAIVNRRSYLKLCLIHLDDPRLTACTLFYASKNEHKTRNRAREGVDLYNNHLLTNVLPTLPVHL